MSDSGNLRLRLKNCLQTILDLKEDIDALPYGDSFMTEIQKLESFLDKLSGMAVSEGEVLRVERATARFLKELHPALLEHNPYAAGKNRLQ